MKKFTVHSMVVLIAVSTLFRGLLFGYETYGFMAVISLLSFMYFFSKVRNDEEIHIHKIYTALSILLIAAYVLASVHAVNPRANLGSILLYTELATVFHVLYDYFYAKQQQLIQETMWMVVATGFAAAIIGLEALTYSFSILDSTIFAARLGSAFQYTNTAAIYLSICILFALTLINTLKNPILKALLAGASSILILALFMTGSRGGWLVGCALIFVFLLIQPGNFRINSLFSIISIMIPFAIIYSQYNSYIAAHDYINASVWMTVSFISAAVLYSIFLHITWLIKKYLIKGNELRFSKRSGFLTFAIFAGAVVCVLVFWQQFILILPQILENRLKNLNLNDPNILYRIEFDKDALKLAAANWLTGLGGGSWQTRHQSIQDIFYTVTFTHNNYLQIFVEAGILGLLSYILLIFASLIKLLQIFIKTADKIHKAAISGILCSFTALVFHSSFDFDLSYTALALLLWIMFTISAVKTENSIDTIKMNFIIQNRFIKAVPIIICAILISMNSLYFAGAYNANQAIKYVKSTNYKSAMLFYEEAVRLDPNNSEYSAELEKIYYLFADTAQNDKERKLWLDKAITTGELCISSNRYYPAYVQTLIRVYMSANNPEKALKYSKMLVLNQRCFGSNYEVLAKTYLDMANYYAAVNNKEKEKQMLKECIAIESDPNLIKTKSGITFRLTQGNAADNKPSVNLEKYINNARNLLIKIN
jgi:O-antigen ligase